MDRYQWTALYNDNTSLNQIDADGTKHAYSDIDRSKLTNFQIKADGILVLDIPFNPGEGSKLIWRRRVATSPGPTNDTIVHIVGKQEIVGGENRQVVFALHESDGHIDVSDKWDDQHPWFFRVQIHTNEGESE